MSTTSAQADYPIRPVPFTDVRLDDGFWAPRIETNRAVTIPFAFEQCRRNGRMDNFERAAAAVRGEPVSDKRHSEFPFDDTDVYKVIEGAAYAMALKPDPQLDAYIDTLIEGIAAAQEPDGYLFTARTLAPDSPHAWAGDRRWVLERELSHELYNLGHLYEAAVAHFQATRKRSLLEIAIRTADLLVRTFGPGRESIWPGHQITEMGLVKLYRATRNQSYLDLARYLLDVRGPDGQPGSGRAYNQSHIPVVQQREAVGHAVRAAYMYAGMADVAAITGDTAYVEAIDAIWDNVATAKLYLTGGIGARHEGEAFGDDFELPNLSAYAETCAAIGNVYWNHRLFLLHGDGRYIDVLERSLYNGLISGVSLDGKGFFYPNPLASDGRHARSPWFGCACCPSNICRFMASLPGYVYAQRDDALYVNLYVGGSANLTLENGARFTLRQNTQYPWDGRIRLVIDSLDAPCAMKLKLRIPGWARGEPVPSELYRFMAGQDQPDIKMAVNGIATTIEIDKGYVTLDRLWQAGDTVDLVLPMPVQRVFADTRVVANRGRVALQRGPIVYCVEWPDLPGGAIHRLLLPDGATLETVDLPDELGGGVGVRAIGQVAPEQGPVIKTEFMAIPYFAWAHRGKGEMAVWIARDPTALQVVEVKPAESSIWH